MVDGGARGAEDQRVLRLVVAQHVDDGILAVARGDSQRAVFDVDMLLLLAVGGDAHGIALVALGQLGDGVRDRCREHQRAALGGRCIEDEFEVFAEAEIEHLVGLVEHHRLQPRHVERAARDVVAQAAGRADDDMGAAFSARRSRAHVHAADAGDDARAGHLDRAIPARA